ncbi:MAG TPA: glycosyltransferase family 61 protein, partial [Chitinophagaceae bacterium]|nr:glycosyltransferase family 61 protein [Chitinophagaceae bacterium]
EQKTFIAELADGRVWGANGAVITSDDYLLEDVSREFGKYGGVFGKAHSVFGRMRLGKIEYYNRNVAVLSTVGCNNYYHWMIDVLPRIAILEEAGIKEQIDFFIIDYSGLPFQKESLLKAGISMQKIIRSNDYWKFHIQAKKLFVPSLPSELSSVNGWQINWLRNIFSASINKTGINQSKIYVSRKKADNRKLLNEDELIVYLRGNGFIVHYPENHSIEKNASVFASAEVIVSLHGAGNTNWVFAAKGVNIIEIFPPKQIYPNYWYIAALLNHRYAYIINGGERLQAGEDPVMNKSNEDSTVYVAALA